jgi:transcriptional regulator with XRE-family HTH domain
MTYKVIDAETREFRLAMSAEIRAWMGRRGLNIQETSAAIGINRMGLSRRLSGDVAFDADDLLGLARLFGCDIDEFLPAGDNHYRRVPTTLAEKRLGQTMVGRGAVVRHQGLEPRTRWYEAFRRSLTRADFELVA